MGNNTSNARNGPGANSNFRRGTGSLGLSRIELDTRSKPSGLYTSSARDDKMIRRLIGDGKLASRLIGTDLRLSSTDVECPICFLHYSQVNTTQCCKASICTECYLQIQDPKERNASCPFCNTPKMRVKVAKSLSEAQVGKREEEEQQIVEATILARANSSKLPALKDELVDVASTPSESHVPINHDSSDSIQSLALTPEERGKLERQMSSQLDHPLLRKMQRDAEEERDRHMVEHIERRAERRRDRMRHQRDEIERLIRSRRAMEQLTGWSAEDEFSEGALEEVIENENSDSNRRHAGGRDRPRRLNDLFMLETALYLNMRDGANSRRDGSTSSSNIRRLRSRNEDDPFLRALMRMDLVDEDEEQRGFGGGLSEETQIEMAIRASLRDEEERQRALENQEHPGVENSDGDESASDNTGHSNNGSGTQETATHLQNEDQISGLELSTPRINAGAFDHGNELTNDMAGAASHENEDTANIDSQTIAVESIEDESGISNQNTTRNERLSDDISL